MLLSLYEFFSFLFLVLNAYSVCSLWVGVNFIVNSLTVKYAAMRCCQINDIRIKTHENFAANDSNERKKLYRYIETHFYSLENFCLQIFEIFASLYWIIVCPWAIMKELHFTNSVKIISCVHICSILKIIKTLFIFTPFVRAAFYSV